MAEKEKNTAEQSKGSVKERICRALDIYPDVFPGTCTVEIRGRNLVVVRECGKILLYTPDRIRIKVSRGKLQIDGKRLECTAYHRGSVMIDGYINSVSFEED